MEVEMTIRGLLMDPVSNMPIVILKDVAGEAVLPIWVGVYEANAIALEMEKVSTPRPMTHDLIKNVLTGLETQVHKVVVTELREDTFYAVIWLERGGEVVSVDSRPSDALALALRVDCPIFVDEIVLKNSKQAANMSDRVFRFLPHEERFVAYPLPARGTYLRDIVFTPEGLVCSASSPLPAPATVEGGMQEVICIDPIGNLPMPKPASSTSRSATVSPGEP